MYSVAIVDASNAHQLSDRYTGLSDRFRSLWTFYQFLGGVFKHQGNGELPFRHDFQALYRNLQALMPQATTGISGEVEHELRRVETELDVIHTELAKIESRFPPSVLRRFFDHLKRQDEKILYALVKFYLRSPSIDTDSFDKLDILLTRLAEVPIDDDRTTVRDSAELLSSFERLAEVAEVPPMGPAEERTLVRTIREIRNDIGQIEAFQALIRSDVYERYRGLKRRLGAAILNPAVLVEIVTTNIEAKNRFRTLYREEEVRILEDTNKIFEIERYLERNPGLASDELRRQLELFRSNRERFEGGRRDGNIKREDIAALRGSMESVLRLFDPRQRPSEDSTESLFELDEDDALHMAAATGALPPEPLSEATSLAELLPPDPLLNEHLHKIMFALELVEWDRSPELLANAKELHGLRLEPWEISAYRALIERNVPEGSMEHETAAFLLNSAALRLRMEEELNDIDRALKSSRETRLEEVLERTMQSLERAREVDRRFQWILEDLLFRGAADRLQNMYRSRFRFLNVYAELWLAHQANGGITPL